MSINRDYGSAYHKRVLELEKEGLTTSDAQGVAEAEFKEVKK